MGFLFECHNLAGCELTQPDPGADLSAIAKLIALFQNCRRFFETDQRLTFGPISPIPLPPRGDLAGRLAAT